VKELNSKMAHGVAWMSLLKISVRLLGLVSTVILARLLVPADFGLIAMATSVIALLELATAFSFDIPLIQNQNADRRHFDTAWTLDVAFHAALSLLLVVLARPAAAFYEEPRLVNVIYVLAAGFFVSGFSNIGVVYFRKELDFRKDFWVMLSKKFIGFAITIPLAFLLRSYWALVCGMVAGKLLSVYVTYLIHPYRPRFSLSCAGEMLGFSKWLVLNNAVQFFRMRSADFIIGRLKSTSELGLFSIAYEISVMPITEIVAPINRVVYSGYAKLSSDPELLRKSICDTLGVVALLALPAGFGLSMVSHPLVDLVLGEKWSGAAPLVGILGIFAALHSLHSNSGSVYNAIGKPWLITFTGFCNITVLIILSLLLISRYGLTGIASAYLLTSVLLTPFNFYVLCTQLNLRASELISVLWRPFLSCIGMVAALHYVDSQLFSGSAIGPAAQLAVLVITGSLVYVVLLMALWRVSGATRTAVEFRLTKVAWRKASTRICGRA
jgi:O-antigen/teichoic acid export membrane protein